MKLPDISLVWHRPHPNHLLSSLRDMVMENWYIGMTWRDGGRMEWKLNSYVMD